jgi:predicted permease
LNLSAAAGWIRPIGLSSVAKFLILPLVTLGFCHLFGLQGEAAIAAILFQALPTASSSYILARHLGGDAPLMAGIIAAQTLIAAVALPVMVITLTPWL